MVGSITGLAVGAVACGPGAPMCASTAGAAGGATGSIVGSCIEGSPSGYVQVSIPLDESRESGSATTGNPEPSTQSFASSTNRTPSSHARDVAISASHLSEASVTALREIKEIQELGSLAQRVAVFGVGLKLLDEMSHPATGLALVMYPPDADVYISGLTAIDRLTACSVRNRVQWRVLDAQARGKKWKTNEERQYFHTLQRQSQRICSSR